MSHEDVTVGAWMIAMNVNHEDDRLLCVPDYEPSAIAVWDIPTCSDQCLGRTPRPVACTS